MASPELFVITEFEYSYNGNVTSRSERRDSETFLLLQSVDMLVKVKDQVSTVRDLKTVGSQLLKAYKKLLV
jgi:hypothetical protein